MTSKTGVVKKSIVERGFGFISSDGEQPDIFYHINDVVGKQMLMEGDKVHFEVAIKKGKLCAKKVQVEGLSGLEEEWFAAALEQDCAKLRSLAAAGQDVNAIRRSKQKCQRCNGTGEGQGGYSGEDIQVSRRNWICWKCKGTGYDARLPTAICLAVQHEKPESLKAIVDMGADVNKQKPLLAATSKGNKGIVPLDLASRKGHTSIALMLLDSGAQLLAHEYYDDYEVEFITADEQASRCGHHETARAIHRHSIALALPFLPQSLSRLVCEYCL